MAVPETDLASPNGSRQSPEDPVLIVAGLAALVAGLARRRRPSELRGPIEHPG
jgi:MYXO-CTERM domain-containing protein